MMNESELRKLKARLQLLGTTYKMKDRHKEILFEASDRIDTILYMMEETGCKSVYDLIVKLMKQEELISDLRKAKMLEVKKRLKKDCADTEELQSYREIGSINELRELKRKDEPMKPKKGLYMYGDALYYCGNCGEHIGSRFISICCRWCGQKIDWGNYGEDI